MKSVRQLAFITILLVLLFAFSVNAQIFLGSVQGFVFNTTPQNVSGVDVTAVVEGKSGAGSSGSTTTDVNGFYIIVNLNANNGDRIIVSANKSNQFGSNNDTADSSGAAFVNVTIFEVPFPPTLTPNNDSHNNTITFFDWTSGTDPQGLPTFDVFTLNGVVTNDTSPILNRTFLAFQNHTWVVQTCNALGCSQPAQDTFELFNDPPPIPVLQAVPDGLNNTILFNWTSGGADPEGDATTFNFELNGNLSTNINPPQILIVPNGSNTWRVQECDPFECSGFATDTFSITNDPPTTPTIIPNNNTVFETVTFSWVSGTDPELGATFDEFQLGSQPIVSPATSGLTTSLTGTIQVVTWRVRTCDTSGGCSAFVENTFIRYTCDPDELVNATADTGGGGGRGGGGGGGSGPVTQAPLDEPPVCRESWICEPYSACSSDGSQTRACVELSGCGTTEQKPAEQRQCQYTPPQTPPITEIPGQIADQITDIVQDVVQAIKEKPEIVLVPMSLMLSLLLIIMLGWRKEAVGVLFHMRVARWKRVYKKDPIKAVEQYFNRIKPQYDTIKDSVLPKTEKMFKKLEAEIKRKY